MPEYGASSIVVLEGLEPVRKRPGMYIGSTSQLGVNECLREKLDNLKYQQKIIGAFSWRKKAFGYGQI